MDVPFYTMIVTVVEECRLAFKRNIVNNLNNSIIFAYPKLGIAFFACLLLLTMRSSSYFTKKKTPNIEKLLITYNTILFFSHVYTFLRCVFLWIRTIYWICDYEDMFSVRISSIPENVIDVTDDMYVFSVIKILELLNTIAGLLTRKNGSALSFNLFEQAMLIFSCWVFTTYYSDSYINLILMTCNSVIHGIKYVYYVSSIVFQVSGMWTQLLFKRVVKLAASVQYIVLLVFAGYLIIIDDRVGEVMRTLIFVNGILVIFLMMKY